MTTAIIAVTACAVFFWLVCRLSGSQQQREIQRLQTENQRQQREIQFLEQELHIAVSISKRLQETLSARFAAVYAPEIQIMPPPQTTPPAAPATQQAAKHFSIIQNGKTYHYINGELDRID